MVGFEAKECFFENQTNHWIHWEDGCSPWISHDHQPDLWNVLKWGKINKNTTMYITVWWKPTRLQFGCWRPLNSSNRISKEVNREGWGYGYFLGLQLLQSKKTLIFIYLIIMAFHFTYQHLHCCEAWCKYPSFLCHKICPFASQLLNRLVVSKEKYIIYFLCANQQRCKSVAHSF